MIHALYTVFSSQDENRLPRTTNHSKSRTRKADGRDTDFLVTTGYDQPTAPQQDLAGFGTSMLTPSPAQPGKKRGLV